MSAVPHPMEAVRRLIDRLEPVGEAWSTSLIDAHGLITAAAVVAERDSPACDVSQMDGYALRLADARPGATVAVVADAPAGRPAPPMPSSGCVRIATGAPVPAGADLVVQREHVEEGGATITLRADACVAAGLNVRRQGENLRAGSVVLPAGTVLNSSAAGACALVGGAAHAPTGEHADDGPVGDGPTAWRSTLQVRGPRVRVAVLTSGDELAAPGSRAVEPWQVRDANGVTTHGMLDALRWVEVFWLDRLRDSRAGTVKRLRRALHEGPHAVLTCGGVSKGERDFVQHAVADVGGEIVFHGLAARPGGPMLGAILPGGRALLGLPGNPVSALVALRRFGLPVLRKLAGIAAVDPPAPRVAVRGGEGRVAGKWAYRPARIADDGVAELLDTRGSGDLPAAARGDGVVELDPAGDGASGRWFGW